MRSLSSLVQVRRNGEVIGNYAPEDLAPFLEKGRLQPDDLCSSKAHPEFIPLSVYLEKVPIEPTPPSKVVITKAQNSSRSRRSSRKQKTGLLLGGWISFLIALAALVGAGFWISGLQKELEKTKTNLRTVEEAKREYQRSFLISQNERNGFVRGSMILRNDAGERVAAPEVEIWLYPRNTIEGFLENRMQTFEKIPPGSGIEADTYFTSDLPEPLAKATTDNSGRFEFEVPEEGRYVLYTKTNSKAGDKQTNKIWFVAFDSRDALNTPVDITDANYVKQFTPSLMIIEGR